MNNYGHQDRKKRKEHQKIRDLTKSFLAPHLHTDLPLTGLLCLSDALGDKVMSQVQDSSPTNPSP